MKFVGLLLAVHEPVQVLALGAAAEAESADPLVLSVDVQVELAAAEVFAAREASVVLEAFCVPEVSVVPEVFAVPEASAALEPFVVPAAVAKVALAAVGVGGVPVVLSAAAAPVAIARCIEPGASTVPASSTGSAQGPIPADEFNCRCPISSQQQKNFAGPVPSNQPDSSSTVSVTQPVDSDSVSANKYC